MIIPVRCVSCGKVIADKWREYQERTGERGRGPGADAMQNKEAAARRAAAMDALGLVRYCCRRHFMGHVELVESIS